MAALPSEFPELLAAARRADDAAWRQLYDALSPKLLAYLRAQRAPDAEDALGDTWLRAARTLDRFSGDDEDFRRWMFTLARHSLIDQRRRTQRRVNAQPADVTGLLEDLAEPGGDAPSRSLLEAEASALLVASLQTLTDLQREALVLRFVGGLRIGEIAEVTGRPSAAVKQAQRRGIAALRKQLTVPSSPLATLIQAIRGHPDDEAM